MAVKASSSNGSDALGGWRTRSHTITCPSGQRLKIRIPGIETLLEHGGLPESLIAIALDEAIRPDGAVGAIAERLPDKDTEGKLQELAQWGEFQRELVRVAVIGVETDGAWEPVELSREDLQGLPDADLELIARIVLRVTQTDARGVTIGVEPLDRWVMFHEAHGLDPADCPACQANLNELSTVDVGQV